MTTWQTIFGVDHPVRGSLSQISGARDTFDSMATDAQNIVDQFANFTDPGFAEGNLNGPPGQLLTRMLSEADGGLQDLPRIANEARGIFADHYTALDGLDTRADEALGRARTAWARKNELLSEQSSLNSQISGLNGQIDNAAPDADTISLDTDLSGAQSSLSSVNGELSSVQATLDSIYGNDDSEYASIASAETSRNGTTRDALDDIDLGDLEDPGFWDDVVSVVGSVVEFLGGLLESIANLLEALVTGDWATFFWELKKLLDVALLVLGTIALFTGIGGPLGLLLIACAVASFAVNTGLYVTQTPNPQTGQTVSLTDVVVSGVGALFAGVSVLQCLRQTTALNVAAGSYGPAASHTFMSTFRTMNAPGIRNGMLPQFLGNLGSNTRNGVNSLLNRFVADPTLPPFPVTPTWRPPYGSTAPLPFAVNAGAPGSWTPLMTTVPLPGSAPTVQDRWGGVLSMGGFDGFNVANQPSLGDQGTPLFGPAAGRVQAQATSVPDVYIAPVP